MQIYKVVSFLCILVLLIISLSSVTFAETGTIKGNVMFSQKAPAGGINVGVSATRNGSTVNTSFTIPEGEDRGNFSMSVSTEGGYLFDVTINTPYGFASFQENLGDSDYQGTSTLFTIPELDRPVIFNISGTVSLSLGTAPEGGVEISISASSGGYGSGGRITIPSGNSSGSFSIPIGVDRASLQAQISYDSVYGSGSYGSVDFNRGNVSGINIIIKPSSTPTPTPTPTLTPIQTSAPTTTLTPIQTPTPTPTSLNNPLYRTISGTVTLKTGVAPAGGIPVYINAIAVNGFGPSHEGIDDKYGTAVRIPEYKNSTSFSIQIILNKSGDTYGFQFDDSTYFMEGSNVINWDSFARVGSSDVSGINLMLEPYKYIPIDTKNIPTQTPSVTIKSDETLNILPEATKTPSVTIKSNETLNILPEATKTPIPVSPKFVENGYIKMLYVSTKLTEKPNLPAKVFIISADGIYSKKNVDWDIINPASYNNTGTFYISGNVSGSKIKAVANVKVLGVKYGNKSLEHIEEINVTTTEGVVPSLPKTVKVGFNDGTSSLINVTWTSIDKKRYKSIGSFTVLGSISNVNLKVIANIKVSKKIL